VQHSYIGFAIFREKIPRNTEQTEIFIHSVCFATLGIPFRAIRWKIKKAQNSVPNHFIEEKKHWNIFFPETFRGRLKCSEFHSEPFCRSKKHSEFCDSLCTDMMLLIYVKSFLLLCWLIHQTSFFRRIPFRFEPRNGLIRDTRNSKRSTFSAE
jgi:hypothetical protein